VRVAAGSFLVGVKGLLSIKIIVYVYPIKTKHDIIKIKLYRLVFGRIGPFEWSLEMIECTL